MNDQEHYTEFFKQHELPPLPDSASIQDIRWKAGTGDWWVRTTTGWYWLRGDSKKQWKFAPHGPND